MKISVCFVFCMALLGLQSGALALANGTDSGSQQASSQRVWRQQTVKTFKIQQFGGNKIYLISTGQAALLRFWNGTQAIVTCDPGWLHRFPPTPPPGVHSFPLDSNGSDGGDRSYFSRTGNPYCDAPRECFGGFVAVQWAWAHGLISPSQGVVGVRCLPSDHVIMERNQFNPKPNGKSLKQRTYQYLKKLWSN